MLGFMRDHRGGPNLRVRTVALLVIVGLLGAPLVAVLLKVVATVFGGL